MNHIMGEPPAPTGEIPYLTDEEIATITGVILETARQDDVEMWRYLAKVATEKAVRAMGGGVDAGLLTREEARTRILGEPAP